MGHSAGAYNAAMVTVEAKWLAVHGIERTAIAGFIGLAGPYDFLPLQDRVTRTVFGHVPDPGSTQPALLADAGTAGTAAARRDDTVYPRNARSLAERLRAVGVAVELRLYPGVGHAGIVLALSPLSRDDPPVASDLARFVAAVRPVAAVQSASERLAAR
jgi:acetyl esterase/lipase